MLFYFLFLKYRQNFRDGLNSQFGERGRVTVSESAIPHIFHAVFSDGVVTEMIGCLDVSVPDRFVLLTSTVFLFFG